MKRYFTAAIILFLFTLICSAAELWISPLFGTNMVLQRSTVAPVWGTVNAGESLSIRFAEQSKQTTADKNGNWKVLLAPLAASSKPSTLTVTSSSRQSVRCDNLLVGDVWLCSGQSNMYMPVKNTDNSAKAIAQANHSQVRLLQMRLKRGAKRIETFHLGTWQECTPGSVKDFSAVAYYFGRKINRDLNVPVGLIQSAVGGTHIERWIPKEDTDPSLEYLSSIGDLYNNMILPFTKFAVRGFL